ncbi:hypothetical protein ACJX0J_007477, partial [Zea mays]
TQLRYINNISSEKITMKSPIQSSFGLKRPTFSSFEVFLSMLDLPKIQEQTETMLVQAGTPKKGKRMANVLDASALLFFKALKAQKDAEDESTWIAFGNLRSDNLDEVTENFNLRQAKEECFSAAMQCSNNWRTHRASEEARRAEEAAERERRIGKFRNFLSLELLCVAFLILLPKITAVEDI